MIVHKHTVRLTVVSQCLPVDLASDFSAKTASQLVCFTALRLFWRRPFRLVGLLDDLVVQTAVLALSPLHPHIHHNGNRCLLVVFVSLILCTPVQSLVDYTA